MPLFRRDLSMTGDLYLNPQKQWIYPQFCVNAKASKKIKVIRGGEQGNIFAALTAAKTEILLTIRKFLLFE